MSNEDASTETQPQPNISTEHQNRGDARRPSDTLDRDPRRTAAGQPWPDDVPMPDDLKGDDDGD